MSAAATEPIEVPPAWNDDPPSSPVNYDEDDYTSDDLEADVIDLGDAVETDYLGISDSALEGGELDPLLDGREDENDYSHSEGDPDSVAPLEYVSASEELEEFERGDPT
jgi:hypothetical protein